MITGGGSRLNDLKLMPLRREWNLTTERVTMSSHSTGSVKSIYIEIVNASEKILVALAAALEICKKFYLRVVCIVLVSSIYFLGASVEMC